MKQARILTSDEFKRLIAVIDAHRYRDRNRAIFYLSFLAGLRACEISALKLCDVVNEDGKVKPQIILDADMTKGDERNRVIVSTSLQKALQAYVDKACISHKPDDPLIKSQKGGAFSPLTIVQLFAKFFKKAGISGASSHSGRRQFITSLAENQINMRVIQVLARHKNMGTTSRYVDVNDVKLHNAVEVVGVSTAFRKKVSL
jgi:integrase/recombinase XerD